MMKARIKDIILIAYVSALAAGCTKDEENMIVSSSVPICLSEVNMGMSTRVATSLNSSSLSNFGIFAGLNERTSPFNDTSDGSNYMQNAKVEKDWTLGTWNTSVPYYWPLKSTGLLSFFAYAPYTTDAEELQLSPAYTTGAPSLMFTPKTNPVKQTDFCVARPLYDKTVDDNPISFNFDHTLTQVRFYANYRGNLPKETGFEYVLRIDKITLHNIMGTKSISFTGSASGYEWSDDDNLHDVDYSLSLSNQELIDVNLPTEESYVELQSGWGILSLLPQTINESTQTNTSTIEIDFSFIRKTTSSKEILSQFNAVKELPLTVWSPCSCVKYYFTLDVENLSHVNITASTGSWIEDWKDSGNTDPIYTIEK